MPVPQFDSSSAIDAICWDWNGTLLDDAELCRSTMNTVLERYGLEPLTTPASYRARFRFPIRDFYSSLGIEGSEFPAAADLYLTLLDESIENAELHPEALSTLDALAERGIRQVLASATRWEALLRQLRPHGITARFEQVLGIDDPYAASKDAVIERWILDSGLEPGRILLVGDTNHDQEIAGRLGTRFVHRAYGHQELALSPDVPRISTLSELLALL